MLNKLNEDKYQLFKKDINGVRSVFLEVTVDRENHKLSWEGSDDPKQQLVEHFAVDEVGHHVFPDWGTYTGN